MSNSNLKIRDETLYKEYKDGGLKNMLIFQKNYGSPMLMGKKII